MDISIEIDGFCFVGTQGYCAVRTVINGDDVWTGDQKTNRRDLTIKAIEAALSVTPTNSSVDLVINDERLVATIKRITCHTLRSSEMWRRIERLCRCRVVTARAS